MSDTTSGDACAKHACPKHIFLRHPPLPQMQGRCYGRLDVALPARRFVVAAARLQRQAPTHPLWSRPIVSSPAARCIWLARACALRTAPTRAVSSDARLLEMDFGVWEGQPWDDIPRDALDHWSRDVPGFRPPGGESFLDLVERVDAALAALDSPHLIVAHAGIVRAAAHLLGGQPLATAAAMPVAYLTPIIFCTGQHGPFAPASTCPE